MSDIQCTTENIDELFDFDESYGNAFNGIENFFRFQKRNPGTVEVDDAYYERVAELLKKRIDHELKHVRNPYLD